MPDSDPLLWPSLTNATWRECVKFCETSWVCFDCRVDLRGERLERAKRRNSGQRREPAANTRAEAPCSTRYGEAHSTAGIWAVRNARSAESSLRPTARR